MKKSILNLDGAQELSKNQQKAIQGGLKDCRYSPCPAGQCCRTTPSGTNYICLSCPTLP